jgi:hypothetical protein
MSIIRTNILRYCVAIIILIAAQSCNDLDLLPESSVPGDGFFTNETEVLTGVAGMYDGLQRVYSRRESHYGGLWSVTELRSDNMTIVLSEGEMGNVDELNFFPTSDIARSFWVDSYLTIARANNVLATLDVVVDADVKDQFEGEAKFVRALAYFNLVRLYGDVPLTVNVTSSTDDLPDLTRVPTSDIYTQIKSDLNDAVSLLPASIAAGRTSLGAAKGLLAKVYLTLGETGSAETLLADVMNDGYALEPSVEDVFSLSNANNDEILFAVAYKSSSNGEGNNVPYLYLDNTVGFTATEDLWNNMPAGNRYDETLFIYKTERKTKKYTQGSTTLYEGDDDWIVLRYADIILMYAEVLNIENGTANMQPAIDELNKIRVRAGLTEYVLADFANTDELEDAIRDERRWELAFEGQRWFDLQRYGSDGIAILSAHLGTTVSTDQLLLPIPQSEINISQNVITQNSGY